MRFDYAYGKDVRDEYEGVSISIERIYPNVAEQMLLANVSNRPMKRESLARAIRNGEWTLNGASIVFSDDGVLLDGQNRLKACIETGVAIDTVVVRGLPSVAQESMDTGVKRQLRDYIAMRGYKNATNLAAITLAMHRADVGGIESAFRKANGSETTMASSLKFFDENIESRIKPMFRDTQKMQQRYRGVASGTLAVVMERIKESANEDDYEMFVRQLSCDAIQCQPVMMLVNRLNTNGASKTGRLPQKTIAALIIKAFNAYMLGVDVKNLKFRQGGAAPEEFPTIYSQ